MSKLILLTSALFLFGLYSCSSDAETGNTKIDSAAIDSAKTDSLHPDSVSKSSGIKNVEELLPQLPLLKFPLILNVDSFEKKTGIAVELNQNLPLFADFLEFPSGTKVKAMGKFYLNANTQVVLYLTEAPNDYPERPDDVELILTIYGKIANTVDSRILAISSSEAYGNSYMKTPNKGKSFVHQEMDEINITFQNFTIKDDQFVLGESIDRKFAGDQKGSDSSRVAIEEFMK